VNGFGCLVAAMVHGVVARLAADLFTGISHLLDQPFLRSAFLAGTCIAVAAGLVGYVVVLRSQVFAADALSHVAFTGALGALAAGIGLEAGLYGACVAFAVLLAGLGRRTPADDTVVGSVFAWVLGLGALFLSLFTTSQSGGGSEASSQGVNVLFGSILGLSAGQALADAALASAVVAVFVVVGRPLVFASVDEGVAAAIGVPVRALRYLFFVLLGVTAGVATQAVGALLLLGLVAAPAGAARRLTARPFVALWLSAGLAMGSVWGGLVVAYAAPAIPPSFGILAAATGAYLASLVATSGLVVRGWETVRRREGGGRRPAPGVRPAGPTDGRPTGQPVHSDR
jgi:zinc/manganese transport system permease protein